MYRRKIRWLVISILLSMWIVSAQATVYQGIVTNVTAVSGTIYIIVNNGTFGPAGAGSCGTGYPTGMVYSIAVTPSASDFNKVMISIALSAKVTGIIVYMAGDGVCTNGNPYNGGGSEGLVYLDLKG